MRRGVCVLNVPSELQLAMLAAVRFAYPSKLGAKRHRKPSA